MCFFVGNLAAFFVTFGYFKSSFALLLACLQPKFLFLSLLFHSFALCFLSSSSSFAPFWKDTHPCLLLQAVNKTTCFPSSFAFNNSGWGICSNIASYSEAKMAVKSNSIRASQSYSEIKRNLHKIKVEQETKTCISTLHSHRIAGEQKKVIF